MIDKQSPYVNSIQFNRIFSNYKITPSSSRGENKINKVIILDTHPKRTPNAGKSGQGVVHVSQK